MGCGGRGRACEWQERPAGRKTGQRRPRGYSSVGPANLPAMRVLPLRETLALLAGLNEESLTALSQAGRRFNRGREDLACDTRRMTLCRRPRCRRRLDASMKSTAPPFDTPRTGRRPPPNPHQHHPHWRSRSPHLRFVAGAKSAAAGIARSFPHPGTKSTPSTHGKRQG